MLLTEILSSPVQWKWATADDERVEAKFQIGEIPYVVAFSRAGVREWNVVFRDVKQSPSWLDRFRNKTTDKKQAYGITGSGNAATVFATVIDVMQAFKQQHKDAVLGFRANEPSRQRLYNTMIKRFAPNAELSTDSSGTTYIIR